MGKTNSFTIFFAFTKPKNFSGQTAASEFIFNYFSTRGVKCIPIFLFPLTRNQKNPLLGYYNLLFKQAKTIPNLTRLLFTRKPILHINLGQSYWSFIRIGIWYFPIKFFNRGIKVVTSLHGSNFMSWESEPLISKIFLKFLVSSKIITVLGENQKKKLVQFGLSPDRIRIVPNACNLSPVSVSFIRNKHDNTGEPVRLLHLSLLIESKGFPLYLEALEILAGRKLDRPVRATLCGPITFSPYCKQFTSVEDKRKWIERKIDIINRTSNGLLITEWIPGATGTIKQKLFENSHIFIFPTSFPVEAQPIVLIEALATGCSIITSTAGEIPTTLNSDCAVFIEKLETEVLANEIYRLIVNPKVRTAMAINGAKLAKGPLSMNSYIRTWNNIFEELKYVSKV